MMPEQPVAIDAATPIPVTMSAGEWNQIMQYLAEQPFKLVAQLIYQIQGQAMAAVQPAMPQSGQIVPTSNGADPAGLPA